MGPVLEHGPPVLVVLAPLVGVLPAPAPPGVTLLPGEGGIAGQDRPVEEDVQRDAAWCAVGDGGGQIRVGPG